MAPKRKARRKPHPETCERCPNRYSERGCPFWIKPEHGVVEEQINNPGTSRVTTGCLFGDGHFTRWLIQIVAASNRPAAAVEMCKTEIALGLQRVARSIDRFANTAGAIPYNGEPPSLPGPEDNEPCQPQ
jgi:hypothetical protein